MGIEISQPALAEGFVDPNDRVMRGLVLVLDAIAQSAID
jgi:hypothetical protein